MAKAHTVTATLVVTDNSSGELSRVWVSVMVGDDGRDWAVRRAMRDVAELAGIRVEGVEPPMPMREQLPEAAERIRREASERMKAYWAKRRAAKAEAAA